MRYTPEALSREGVSVTVRRSPFRLKVRFRGAPFEDATRSVSSLLVFTDWPLIPSITSPALRPALWAGLLPATSDVPTTSTPWVARATPTAAPPGMSRVSSPAVTRMRPMGNRPSRFTVTSASTCSLARRVFSFHSSRSSWLDSTATPVSKA